MFLSSRCTHTPTQTPLQLAHGQLWDHRLQVPPPCRRERVELALDLLEMKVSAPVVRWIMDSGGADGVVEPLWNLWQDRRRRSNCESGPAQAVRQTPAKSLCNVSVALGKSAYLVHAAAQHTRSQPDVVSGGVSDSPALSLVKSVEEDWAAMLGTARREWVQSTAHGRAALRRQLRQAPEAGCPSERVVCVSSSGVGGAEEAHSAKVPLPKIHALEQRWATVSPPRRSVTVASLEGSVDAVGDGIYLSALPASSSSAAFPGVVAAGVAAASCVAHHEVAALRVLSRKTETLLVEIPYALSSSLRTFLLGEPATHAERFRELWLSDTTLSTPKKFRTRAELLFFTVVELVLLAAEQHNRRSGGESSPAALDVLAGWVGAWHGFFQRLHEAAAAPPRRGSMSRGASSSRSDPAAGGGGGGTPRSAAPDEEPAVGQEDERGAHETQDLLKRLCEVLPLRLRDGAAPLPAVADRLMLDPLVGEDEPVASPADALARDFSRAHQAFAREGGGATNDLKLRFYGLYKQATIGDVNVSKPWIVDQVGRAKWEAWHRLHGMSMEEAQQQYVGAYKEFHSGAAPPG